jgi:hypothetical protein
VIDERRIAVDGEARSTYLYPVAVDDHALTALTEYDADGAGGRQLGMPALVFGRRERFGVGGCATGQTLVAPIRMPLRYTYPRCSVMLTTMTKGPEVTASPIHRNSPFLS